MAKFICPLPYMSLSFEAGLKQRICCHEDVELNPALSFDLKRDLDAHRSVMRKQMESGEVPSSCRGCKVMEDQGGQSPRLQYLRKFKDYKNLEIQHFDLTLDNICNFSCRMCTPKYSQPLATEFARLNIPDIDHFTPIPKRDLEEFLEKMSRHFEKAEHFVITGGEPLVSPHAKSLMTKLASFDNASNKTVRLFTNASQFPDWLSQMSRQFKKVELYMSLDASQAAFHYIRYPGQWDDVINFIERAIHEIKRGAQIVLRVHTVIGALNLVHLIPLFEELKKYQDYFPYLPSSSLLYSPKHLAASILPEKFKNQCISDLIKYLSSISSTEDELIANKATLLGHLHEIKSEDNSNRLIEFQLLMKKFDKERKQNINDFLPIFSGSDKPNPS